MKKYFLTLFVMVLAIAPISVFGAANDEDFDQQKLAATNILRTAWGAEFIPNLDMLAQQGVTWVGRDGMKIIAKMHGFPVETNGINIKDEIPQKGIYIVWDDVSPLMVAKTLNSLVTRQPGLDESAVRKLDEEFLRAALGSGWLETTKKGLVIRTSPDNIGGKTVYRITEEATAFLNSRLTEAGHKPGKSKYEKLTIERLVFDLTNTREAIATWLGKGETSKVSSR